MPGLCLVLEASVPLNRQGNMDTYGHTGNLPRSVFYVAQMLLLHCPSRGSSLPNLSFRASVSHSIANCEW